MKLMTWILAIGFIHTETFTICGDMGMTKFSPLLGTDSSTNNDDLPSRSANDPTIYNKEELALRPGVQRNVVLPPGMDPHLSKEDKKVIEEKNSMKQADVEQGEAPKTDLDIMRYQMRKMIESWEN